MALRFGYKTRDQRESIWRDDPALANVPEAALDAWREDADASHLRPYATNGKPTIITFRALDIDEAQFVRGFYDHDSALASIERMWLYAFRIAVDFTEAPSMFRTPDGADHSRVVREKGFRMLSREFVAQLMADYRGIIGFYGNLVWQASNPTEPEKKASSPQSTQIASAGDTAAQPTATAPEAA